MVDLPDKCPICFEEFDDNPESIPENSRSMSHLPVKSSNCAHLICYSCIQNTVVGKIELGQWNPRRNWLECLLCREKSFNTKKPIVDLNICALLRVICSSQHSADVSASSASPERLQGAAAASMPVSMENVEVVDLTGEEYNGSKATKRCKGSREATFIGDAIETNNETASSLFTKESFLNKSILLLNTFLSGKGTKRESKGFGPFIREGAATPGFSSIETSVVANIVNKRSYEEIRDMLSRHNPDGKKVDIQQAANWLKNAIVGSLYIIFLF